MFWDFLSVIVWCSLMIGYYAEFTWKTLRKASTIIDREMEELSRAAAAAGRLPKPVVGAGNCYLDLVALSSEGDDIMNHQNNSNITELPSSSCSSKSAKHGLSSQLWSGGATASNGGAKPLRLDLINSYSGGVTSGAEENTISYVSLLNQLPVQNAAFQPGASLIGSLSDGVLRQQFQLPTNINWNS